MDFEYFKKINDERMNYGEIEDATVVSSYRNTGCGDGYRLYLKIDENDPNKKILDASYTTTGCGFGLASLAMATEWIKGKTLATAKKVSVEDIENLFEFPPRRKNYPASAVECLQKAIADYHNGTGIHPSERITKKMLYSLLKKQGHLRNANLRQIVLGKDNLEGINFSGADLSHAFLTECNFDKANFQNARLRGAFFNNSSLRKSNFEGSDIRWTKFTGANLEKANFNNASYDIGTRLDPRDTHLFSTMQKKDEREIYLDKLSNKKENT